MKGCTDELATRNTVKEAGRTPPPFPFIFFKPNTTVQDHGAPVEIPLIAQDDQADYEGELVCPLFFFFPLRSTYYDVYKPSFLHVYVLTPNSAS